MVALLNPNIHGLVSWTPSIGRKVGIPRGILPHVQTGLTLEIQISLSHPGLTIGNKDLPGSALSILEELTILAYVV